MRVLGIVCSLRINGNTQILVQEALDSAKEAGANVELLRLEHKNIYPCDGCGSCLENGECVMQDDMQDIYPELEASDGIILGTPVYFWSIAGQAKVFMDRTRGLARTRKLRNKIGGIIVVQTRGGATFAFNQVVTFFNLHRMLIAGGAIAFGNNPGDVREDKQGLSEARATGKALVGLISKLSTPR